MVNSSDSFRVPNSIVQGLTTTTTEGLNKLKAFQMVVLLGMLTKVSSKSPGKEVRVTVTEVLKIVDVSRKIACAVDRKWQTKDGDSRQRSYASERFSPAHVERVHEALLMLHGQTVVVRGRSSGKSERTDHVVHILDSFGYVYEQNGEDVDLDSLPPDREKVNVGSDKRPVYRSRKRTAGVKRFDRTKGVVFRLNSELANELCKKKGTIGFSLFANKVFQVFQRFMKKPTAIRLIVLILRQVEPTFTRRLDSQLTGLGWDMSHPSRAVTECEATLHELKELGLVVSYQVDKAEDLLQVHQDKEWYKKAF